MKAAVACLSLLLAVATPLLAAQGSDLAGGYIWWDSDHGAVAGPGFFDGTVTTLNPPNDAAPEEVLLPWSFPYYGGTYDRIWISDNGWISFQDPRRAAIPTPDVLPSVTAPPSIVAVYWGDLDCSDPGLGTSIRHGRVASAGAFRVQYTALDVNSGSPVFLDLYLYQDGRLKLQYRSVPGWSGKTVGLQEASGTDGFAVVGRGVPAAGVTDLPAADHVIDILPPPLLLGECGAVPALACGVTLLNESLPGSLPNNIAVYGCDDDAWWARERIHSLTLTQATRLQATLTPGTGADLGMHLVRECSERLCIAGPGTSLDVMLGPGSYQVVVDAPFVADEGSYTLELDCAPLGERIRCGDVVNDDTRGGTDLFFRQDCSGLLNFSGTERLYTFDVPEPNSVAASLTTALPELDVLLFRVPPDGGLIAASDCLRWGDENVVLGDLPAGEYLLAVDGTDGLAGPFALELACDVDLRCNVEDSLDLSLASRWSIAGDTSTGVAGADRYSCRPELLLDGSELVYELVVPSASQVAVHEAGAPSGLSFFILDSCNEGGCLGDESGSCGSVLEPGLHYLVVDGPAGADAAFQLELVVTEAFGHWSSCEQYIGAGPIDSPNAGLTEWNFDDGAYCFENPESFNYPDGCEFGMYVAVRCGTAFHIPLQDVESGHVRIFDVFAGEYVELSAVSTSGWTDSGDDISWQDCNGENPFWNEQTTDIFFEGADGLCGVYRLEFPQHAGFVWDLYANCSGDNTPEYPIYESLCGALAAFDPLPNLFMESADVVLDCPNFTAHYTIGNDGCVQATDVVVTILDGAVAVGTDVVALVLPGETITGSFPGTFPGGMSGPDVRIEVDPEDLILECIEVLGAGCVSPRPDVVLVADCAAVCEVVAAGTAEPALLCPGSSFSIDGSESTYDGCPSDQLEYQLTGPSEVFPWQTSPRFTDVAGIDAADYELEVRCSDPVLRGSCVDSTTISVMVRQGDPALLPVVGASLRVGSPASYGESLVPLRWETESELDVAADEHFHVLRSSTPDSGFVRVNPESPALLRVPLFTDTDADRPDVGAQVEYYLAFVSTACHDDNRFFDNFRLP